MKTKRTLCRSSAKRVFKLLPVVSMVSALLTPQIVFSQSTESKWTLDYDGDSIDDVVYRRTSSFQNVIRRSSDGAIQSITFGRNAGDVPVVGDFDGDQISDIAVRRASNQTWYIQNSSGTDSITGNSDGITRRRFGLQIGDIPLAADYDGDGVTDLAVRRPSNQTWYILNSSGTDSISGNSDGITRSTFGLREDDIPVPADYDGDGKVDLAVRRASNQTWYILNSSGVDSISGNADGITRRIFGRQEADIPVPADYDGDGKADLAVRRPSNQTWYILNSSGEDTISGNADGITRRTFGRQEADLPAPADYDGDGKVDLAVRRGSTNQWFILNSSGTDPVDGNSDAITRLSFGNQSTDMPFAQPLHSLWGNSDIDQDGLSKTEEDAQGSDFTASDSDGDGLNDGEEVNTYNTNPIAADSDNDGLDDGDEINIHNTDPTNSDTDGDGLSDGDEINIHGTDPNNEDSDGDGVNDGDEVGAGTDPKESEPEVEFSESNLLTSIVDGIYVPTFELFAEKAEDLNTAVAAYCAALPNDANNSRGAAQDQWKNAMDTWQMIELMQVGPLFFNGNELRNNVYSWPNNRACSVDQDVVAAEEAGYDITTRNVARKGMDALEYLLFDTDLDHKCTVASLAPVGWNDRTEEDRTAARCNFASTVSADVLTTANNIVEQWSGDDGYANVLKDAGNPGSEFGTSLEAINDISDGLFYFTGAMKDGKIAAPVGLRVNDCGLVPCIQNAESVYADYSLENIINNMKALRVMLLGSAERDASFVDFLIDVGDADTASNIIEQLDEAITLAEGLTGTYSEALTNTPDTVEQLHEEVNEVDNILKGDFLDSLALELPSTSAGDND